MITTSPNLTTVEVVDEAVSDTSVDAGTRNYAIHQFAVHELLPGFDTLAFLVASAGTGARVFGNVWMSHPDPMLDFGSGLVRRQRPRNTYVTSSELMTRGFKAVLRVVSHTDRPRPTPQALRAATHVIRSLAFDNAPTPQPGYLQPGGIEIEWVVNGWCLNVSCYDDGALSVWATGDAGKDLFAYDLDDQADFGGEVLRRLISQLREMSAQVRYRVGESTSAGVSASAWLMH